MPQNSSHGIKTNGCPLTHGFLPIGGKEQPPVTYTKADWSKVICLRSSNGDARFTKILDPTDIPLLMNYKYGS